MPKETSTTAHPELADLAASLGYTYRTPIGRMGDWWDRRTEDARLLARVLAEDDGFEVYAFDVNVALLWSARLTSGTPAAVLAAAMAVAAEGTR